MGICQTVGGAATSGAGISASEIAFCLRTVISSASPPADKAEAPPAAVGSPGPPSAACIASFQPLPEDAFRKAVVLTTEGPASPSTGKRETYVISAYAPEAFARIRLIENVRDDHMLSEFDLPPDAETALGEGRSMAMFLKSKNKDYMCKTIALAEVEVLLDILKAYSNHLQRSPDSLLMRFLLLMKIEVRETVGYILCFSDVFAACESLNERWDIKGRVPKPGKFRHFPVKSLLKPDVDELDASRPGRVNRGDKYKADQPPAAAAHASSHRLTSEHTELASPRSPSSQNIATQKDKELTRLFWMPSAERDALISRLHADFDFLCQAGLMDYSVLVGVRYTEGSVFTSMRAKAHIHPPDPRKKAPSEKRKPTLSASPENTSLALSPRVEMAELGGGRGSSQQHTCRSRYHHGIHSIFEEETYYIGIIDMLTYYSGKKKSANFFKTCLWEERTLSTIPPVPYCERIKQFTYLVFASPEDPIPEVVP